MPSRVLPSPHDLAAERPAASAGRRRLLGLVIPTLALGVVGSTAVLAGPRRGEVASPSPTSFYANFIGTRLLDQEGRPLAPARLAGRLVLVHFVYTGCSTICPLQTRALADLQSRLPRDLRARVHLLSISLDPLNDTPQVLKAFAQRMGADLSGWTLATGRPQDVERLSESLRLFRPGPDTRKPDDHSTALWLLDAKGDMRMRYGGNPPDVPRLLREIAALDALA